MPTPPIGDIACAASPMQSKPGRCHFFEPVDAHFEQRDLRPIVDLARRVAQDGYRFAISS